jgi:hypothetical protein
MQKSRHQWDWFIIFYFIILFFIPAYKVLWSHSHPHTLFSLSLLLLALPPPKVPFLHSCPLFFRPRLHVWKRICDVCLSESGLSHLIWWFRVPSTFRLYGWVILHCEYTHHTFFISSSIGGHLCLFCSLIIVNRAAINTAVQVSYLSSPLPCGLLLLSCDQSSIPLLCLPLI